MAQNFFDVLRIAQRGNTVEQLNDSLAELTKAVMDARGSGSLTLKISLKPDGDNSVEMDSTVTLKKPNIKRGKTIMFVSPEGALVRNDPRQIDMPLRAVPVAAAPQSAPMPVALPATPVVIQSEAPKEVAAQ